MAYLFAGLGDAAALEQAKKRKQEAALRKRTPVPETDSEGMSPVGIGVSFVAVAAVAGVFLLKKKKG